MKFRELRKDIGFKNIDSFGKSSVFSILLALSLVPIIRYLTANPLILICYSIIGVVAIKYFRVFYKDWSTKKDELGEINFDNKNEKININNTDLKYDELEKVKFRFNYIKGRNYAHYDVLHNGISELNYIKSNGKNEFLKFVIETEEQLSYLKETFKLWYLKGVIIDEEFTSEKHKTLCLEPIADKSYDEIQSLKLLLKIESSR